MRESQTTGSWFDRPIFLQFPAITIEKILFALIVVLAATSRLYDLGVRVMSHDESLHVYYSWLFSIGKGYIHTPTTHGPLQFHLIAFIYTLLGDTDFTARLPHAIASIFTVILLWNWRHYLGRVGMLISSALVLISPYMLYYGRYARNEVFVAVLGILTIYAILRYLETGRNRYFLLLTIATALHFTVKETSFIYSAQAMLFLAFFLVNRVVRLPWKNSKYLNGFFVLLSMGILLIVVTVGLTLVNRPQTSIDIVQTSAPLIPGDTSNPGLPSINFTPALSMMLFSSLAILGSVILLIIGFGWNTLRREQSFDMLILLSTFVLPQLTSFPVKMLGWNPLDYIFTWPGWNWQGLWSQGPFKTATVLIFLVIISILIGFLWDWRKWLLNAAIFWGIYIFFYSSAFTNWAGLATGIVGSLGYWLEQQAVQRGGQPWYYYLLIQIPLYEFLPASGLILAAFLGFKKKTSGVSETKTSPEFGSYTLGAQEFRPTFNLLFWWALSSLLAFSIAGEKMPWLTVHITLPMILLTGWALGKLVERVDWENFDIKHILTIALILIFFIGLSGALSTILGRDPPFQGKTLANLTKTGTFLFQFLSTLSCLIGLVILQNSWKIRNILKMAILIYFCMLGLLTVRTAIRAAYIHPNDATEYLVYAHGATGVADVMAQIAKISTRISGGETLSLAMDNSSPDGGVAWPFTWYLRHYPNVTNFDKPDSNLVGIPAIIVDQKNFDSIKSIVGNDYYRIEYIRMVWPNQDYFNLTWSRIKDILLNPSTRAAIWQIWLNRDYSEYASTTGKTDLNVSDWNPSDKMELFIRKDVASKIWDYNVLQATSVQSDPYEKGKITLQADLLFGEKGASPGQLDTPHGIAIAPDGTLFIADTNNNRIQHFSADGKFLNSWGSFGDNSTGNASPGTFNQPWALAVSPDGKFVYVADTWNHRVQKFTVDGSHLLTWGIPLYDTTSTNPFGLWGPRAIVVDSKGDVFVADTGNKRILAYDAEGNFLFQLGNEGSSIGQFEEPVGLTFDSRGYLYVADTWNQRIQGFAPGENDSSFIPLNNWDVYAWYGESLDNKPYLAADNQGHIFATDPEAYRVLEFSSEGTFIRTWGEIGTGADNFGLGISIAVDSAGHVWVSDASNNRIMRFTMP